MAPLGGGTSGLPVGVVEVSGGADSDSEDDRADGARGNLAEALGSALAGPSPVFDDAGGRGSKGGAASRSGSGSGAYAGLGRKDPHPAQKLVDGILAERVAENDDSLSDAG